MKADFSEYLERIEKEIQNALPPVPSDTWKQESFGILPPSVENVHIAPLTGPTRSLILLGGKRWRPLLLVLTAKAELGRQHIDSENSPQMNLAFHLVPLVEFIHTASLIHDDIEDRSDTRRGKPAAYITYGTDVALNSASWLYFEAGTCIQNAPCSDSTKLALYEAYTQEVRRLHLGQAMDIAWHNSHNAIPSAEQYIAMVKNKTGTLASLAIRTGLLACNADPDLIQTATEASQQIGAGFQIIDDVINLTTGNAGKKRGDDIVEGKKSLPVLLFLAQNRGDTTLSDCFEKARNEGIDSPAVEEAIGLLESSGAIDSARSQGILLIQEGCAGLTRCFGSGNEASALITGLFTSMIPARFAMEKNRG
ncbi:MAG: polyprenyl synthetase family protein [Treponema sp.]|nr:polyprenyl synthetase family protein [Treponema sp.]